jgi:hypothetical protein
MFEESVNPLVILAFLYLVIQVWVVVFYLVRRTNSKKCPVCSNPYGSRTKRPLYVKLFLFFIPNVKFYSCLNCGSKYFYLSTASEKREVVNEK